MGHRTFVLAALVLLQPAIADATHALGLALPDSVFSLDAQPAVNDGQTGRRAPGALARAAADGQPLAVPPALPKVAPGPQHRLDDYIARHTLARHGLLHAPRPR